MMDKSKQRSPLPVGCVYVSIWMWWSCIAVGNMVQLGCYRVETQDIGPEKL